MYRLQRSASPLRASWRWLVSILISTVLIELMHNGKANGQDVVAEGSGASIYQPEFPNLSRTIIGRQSGDSDEVRNNEPGKKKIQPGEKHYWKFPASELRRARSTEPLEVPLIGKRATDDFSDKGHVELRRQATDPVLHITLSTCSQPLPKGPQVNQPPAQLILLVSWKNPRPGEGSSADTHPVTVTEGYGRYDNPMSDDFYMTVEAPSNPDHEGSYSYEIAGSIDGPYSEYKDSTFLHALDTDSGAGLLITSSLTDQADPSSAQDWMKHGPRFSIFGHIANDTQFAGIRRSYCGLNRTAQIGGGSDVQSNTVNSIMESGITMLGGGTAKQQFYVGGLKKTSKYNFVLGLNTNYSKAGSGHPGGGGTVWKSIDITTKTGAVVPLNFVDCAR